MGFKFTLQRAYIPICNMVPLVKHWDSIFLSMVLPFSFVKGLQFDMQVEIILSRMNLKIISCKGLPFHHAKGFHKSSQWASNLLCNGLPFHFAMGFHINMQLKISQEFKKLMKVLKVKFTCNLGLRYQQSSHMVAWVAKKHINFLLLLYSFQDSVGSPLRKGLPIYLASVAQRASIPMRNEHPLECAMSFHYNMHWASISLCKGLPF